MKFVRALVTGGVFAVVAVGTAAGDQSPPKEQKPTLVQPGAPGQPSELLAPGSAAKLKAPDATGADITFMQGMIHHHAQALDMTELLADRSNDPDMKKLGLKIHVSQTDEIKTMQHWLEARGQEAPGRHVHSMPGMPAMPLMPGMLNAEEMARLAAAKGPEFDRLFLEGMIRHHAGALTMVAELFASPGAAQESDIFAFASDVDADQRMEIARMSAMLKERTK